MDLTNASAIVTGGAGSFGFATVRRLAQMGAKVVIADVSDERGEALAREVGAGSLYVPTDSYSPVGTQMFFTCVASRRNSRPSPWIGSSQSRGWP